MFLLINPSIDPFFNLALEEYLFKNESINYFLLYRNSASVIIGKHQNPYKECNTVYLSNHKIPVIRRISGGGTVYHDEGNINFSLIINAKPGKQIDFKNYTLPILDFLKSLGLDASFSKRNDILLKGFKISGNAEHVVKNRVLHHGTLLFNTDLKALSNSLISKNKYLIQTNAVDSVRSKVANISDYLNNHDDTKKFCLQLANYIKKKLGATFSDITEDQKSQVRELAASKYESWDWNYGYSPLFSIQLNDSLKFIIDKGIISMIEDKNNLYPELSKALLNKRFEFNEIKRILDHLTDKQSNTKMLLEHLF